MTLGVSDLQSDSDLDSIRNSCDVLCVCAQAESMMSLPWSLPKKERRHRSCKICAVDKSFIQLQFHETNTLIVQLFGQLTKGFFYNMKILTLSCFRRHKDLKLLLNLLAETSGVPQFCICWPNLTNTTS